MAEREQKIQKLKEYFEKHDDVAMAFLFGSQAKERVHSGSDWDIAVYFTPSKVGPLEYENIGGKYPHENRLWGELTEILETDSVDLVVLNRAPAAIADTAIRGMPLTVKDRTLWIEFSLRISSAAIDFRKTAREYADVYWRSMSLTEEDKYALERRLIFLDVELRVLQEYRGLAWSQYQQDHRTRRIVERTIENIMNAVINSSKLLLASAKKPVPQTYKEIVRLVGTLPGFNHAMTDRLASWAELRNIIAHEYLDYRWEEIGEFLRESGACIQQFVDAAKKFMEEESPKD